jgi:L-lactate dehydrogenase complex protein LldG
MVGPTMTPVIRAGSTARDEVLDRVRRALSVTGPAATAPAVPRDYRTKGAHPPASPELLERFAERVEDYRAHVTRCAEDDASIQTAVRSVLFAADARTVVTPSGLPAWVAQEGHVVDHPDLTAAELDAIQAVVTGCAVAIAETGTIVLDGALLSGRRIITLVPDLHVCVVRAGQVVGSVPEALAVLDPAQPLTFISGPSATSDIELERVEGVHGPRHLHVVLATPA